MQEATELLRKSITHVEQRDVVLSKKSDVDSSQQVNFTIPNDLFAKIKNLLVAHLRKGEKKRSEIVDWYLAREKQIGSKEDPTRTKTVIENVIKKLIHDTVLQIVDQKSDVIALNPGQAE